MSAWDGDRQVAWDATSLREFLVCPRRYELSIVRGYQLPDRWSVAFGTLYHEALARLDRGEPIREVVRWAASRARTDLVDAPGQLSPEALVRAVVWYRERWGSPAFRYAEVRGKPAIELPWRFDLDGVTICGHFDGIGWWEGSWWVIERKTTRASLGPAYFDPYRSDLQVRLYSLAARILFRVPVTGVLVDACQTAVGFARFARVPVLSDESLDEETLAALAVYVRRIEEVTHHGYFAPNFAACRMYGGCPFISYCATPPKWRDGALLAYDKRPERWDPLARDASR